MTAIAIALETLGALIQRESNVLAYVDGFWFCSCSAILALLVVGPMTRAPPGPFTPESFGVAKARGARHS